MEIKITRRKKIKETSSSMTHNYYFLYQGRIYSDDGEYFRRFKFVVWFDSDELYEYYEDLGDDYVITDNNVWEFANELAYNTLAYIDGFDDCDYFYEYCNTTIENYNKTLDWGWC